jgi:hypothetical protein
MECRDFDLLVEIFVPTHEGAMGRIGTGYPVAKDRILTARHVLFPDGRDPETPFQIRWYHLRGTDSEAGRWQTIQREQILWPPPERGTDPTTPDAALIAHPFPAEATGWRPLCARSHATGTPWESQGFANAGVRDDDTRVPVPMRGKTYQKATRATEAWVDVAAEAKAPDGWKGASGCPVLVFSQVVGIIARVPPGFGGKMLNAVPATELLADEAFCAALGYPAPTARRKVLIERLTAIRDQSSVAIGALETCLDPRGDNALWRDPEKPVNALADALMQFDVSTLLWHAAKACANLGPARRDDALALANLVQQVLPLLYDHTAVEEVRRANKAPNAVLVGIPVATRATAEVVLAGVAGRAARFRTPREGQELEGLLSLPQPPNPGIDPGGERREEDYREQLRRKMGIGTLGEFQSAFYRCADEFVPASVRARAGGQDEIVRDMAASRLRSLAGQNRRHYYLFELPDDPEGRAQCLTTLRRLKGHFDAVDFLEIAIDPERLRGEYQDFLPLEIILAPAPED